MSWVRRILGSLQAVPMLASLALVLAALVAIEAVASTGARWPLGPGTANSVLITGPGTGASAPPLTVEALGAVLTPGVYQLPAGDHVRDLVAAAGGALADADLSRIDLAARLADGQAVYVPRVGEQMPIELGGRIDINTSSAADLHDALGLSLAVAQRIVAYRVAHGWFTAVSQLLLVPLSRTEYDRIKDLVTV